MNGDDGEDGDVTDFPGSKPLTDKEKYDAAVHRQNGTSEKTHWPDGTPKTPYEQRMQACLDRIHSPENRRLRPARKARLDAMFTRIAETDPADLTPRERKIKELLAKAKGAPTPAPKTIKSEDEQNERLVKAALKRMFGPPGQETRTHWADGSAKTPEELKLEFVKPPTPEERARNILARKIAKVLIAKKVPVERLKKMLADSKADHNRREDFRAQVIVKRLDAVDARLGRIERALRMRRRVRA